MTHRWLPFLGLLCLLFACAQDDDDKPGTAVTITSPLDSYVWQDTTWIEAACQSGNEVDYVAFYLDNTLLGTDSDSPYRYPWVLGAIAYGEEHELLIKRVDTDGAETYSRSRILRRMPFPFSNTYLADFSGYTGRNSQGLPDGTTDTRDWLLKPVAVRQNPGRYAGMGDVYIYNSGLHVYLQWTTNAELDNLGFNIYRTTIAGQDGFEGAMLLNRENLIPGAGTTIEKQEYSWIDSLNLNYDMTYYYWLETVDTEQQTMRFGPYEHLLSDDEDLVLTISPVYPNPASGQADLIFTLDDTYVVSMLLTNSSGELVSVWLDKETMTAGSGYRYRCDLRSLAHGLYRCIYYFDSPATDYWGYGDIQVQ